MPTNCCVRYCKSNYYSGKYIPVFSFPTDEERRKLWLKIIPRQNLTVTKHTAVCILHFPEEKILREIRGTCADGSVLVTPRRKLALADDAVPSIFPGPPDLASGASSRHKNPEKRLKQKKLETTKKRQKEDTIEKADADDTEEVCEVKVEVSSDLTPCQSELAGVEVDKGETEVQSCSSAEDIEYVLLHLRQEKLLLELEKLSEERECVAREKCNIFLRSEIFRLRLKLMGSPWPEHVENRSMSHSNFVSTSKLPIVRSLGKTTKYLISAKSSRALPVSIRPSNPLSQVNTQSRLSLPIQPTYITNNSMISIPHGINLIPVPNNPFFSPFSNMSRTNTVQSGVGNVAVESPPVGLILQNCRTNKKSLLYASATSKDVPLGESTPAADQNTDELVVGIDPTVLTNPASSLEALPQTQEYMSECSVDKFRTVLFPSSGPSLAQSEEVSSENVKFTLSGLQSQTSSATVNFSKVKPSNEVTQKTEYEDIPAKKHKPCESGS